MFLLSCHFTCMPSVSCASVWQRVVRSAVYLSCGAQPLWLQPPDLSLIGILKHRFIDGGGRTRYVIKWQRGKKSDSRRAAFYLFHFFSFFFISPFWLRVVASLAIGPASWHLITASLPLPAYNHTQPFPVIASHFATLSNLCTLWTLSLQRAALLLSESGGRRGVFPTDKRC